MLNLKLIKKFYPLTFCGLMAVPLLAFPACGDPNATEITTTPVDPEVVIDPVGEGYEEVMQEFSNAPECSDVVGPQMAQPVPGYVKTSDIRSYFGMRIHPVTKKKKMHTGIDIAAPKGTSIVAADGGDVIHFNCGGYGKCLFIKHDKVRATLYGHASALFVKEGQYVNKGDIIAQVGSTGVSTGPHLHFEVQIKGAPTNPLPYLTCVNTVTQTPAPTNGKKIEMTIGSTTYSIDGKSYSMSVSPEIQNDRTFIPLRSLEAFGAKVSWEGISSGSGVATISAGTNTIEFYLAKSNSINERSGRTAEWAQLNNNWVQIDPSNSQVKPYLNNSRTMVPLRFATESLGYKVTWDGNTKKITIER